jgi:hypothetical protein
LARFLPSPGVAEFPTIFLSFLIGSAIYGFKNEEKRQALTYLYLSGTTFFTLGLGDVILLSAWDVS